MIVAINIAIIILEILGLRISISERKVKIFAFYTQISNIITLIASAVLLISGADTASAGSLAATLRYVSSCMLTMTFMITLFVLVPMGGGFRKLMLSGNGLYHHTLCPVLSVGSYVLLEPHATAWIIPTSITFVYGIVMLVMNAKGKFDGPYPFFRVHNQSQAATVIWMMILTGIIAAISIAIAHFAP